MGMNILIVNDDGIEAEGLRRLAAKAAEFGSVWVVAPDHPCSGMSQQITIREKITIAEQDFPVPGVERAFSCSGTPADCTDTAVSYLMGVRPDVIFSGINRGYNAGYDIAYSGTVGAAMEGLMLGIPAVAFSHEPAEDYAVTEFYIREITARILSGKSYRDRIWNVNFPECTLEKCRGIRWDTFPAPAGFFRMSFRTSGPQQESSRSLELINADIPEEREKFPEGSDLAAISDRYISVGTVRCSVLS